MLQAGPLHGQCVHHTCDPESSDTCSYSSLYELQFHVDGSSMPLGPSLVTTFDAVVRPSSRVSHAFYSPAHFTGTRSSISMEAPYRWIHHQESSYDTTVRPSIRATHASHMWSRFVQFHIDGSSMPMEPSLVTTFDAVVRPTSRVTHAFYSSAHFTGICSSISMEVFHTDGFIIRHRPMMLQSDIFTAHATQNRLIHAQTSKLMIQIV